MTSIQQQRLIGAFLLVIFVIVLAYVVLAKVGDSNGTSQQDTDEPIDFSSVIEPLDEDGEALVDADTGTVMPSNEVSSSAPSETTAESGKAGAETDNSSAGRTGVTAEAAQESTTDTQQDPDPAREATDESESAEIPQPQTTNQPQAQSNTLPPESGATDADNPTVISEPNAGNQAAGGRWAIQLGSFSVQKNAQSLKADLEKLGYKPYIENTQTDKGFVYRVRLPSVGSRDDADEMAQRISDKLDINAQVMEQ